MHTFIPKALTQSLGVFDPRGNAVTFTPDLLFKSSNTGNRTVFTAVRKPRQCDLEHFTHHEMSVQNPTQDLQTLIHHGKCVAMTPGPVCTVKRPCRDAWCMCRGSQESIHRK